MVIPTIKQQVAVAEMIGIDFAKGESITVISQHKNGEIINMTAVKGKEGHIYYFQPDRPSKRLKRRIRARRKQL